MDEALHDYFFNVIAECCGSVETVFSFAQRTSETGYSSFITDQVYVEIITWPEISGQVVFRRMKDKLPDQYSRTINIHQKLFVDHEQVMIQVVSVLLYLQVSVQQDALRKYGKDASTLSSFKP